MATTELGPVVLSVKITQQRHASPDDGWACLSCRDLLDVHQPDAANPARLLATCPGCGAWYLLDFEDADEETTASATASMSRLPSVQELERAGEAFTAPGRQARGGRSPLGR